MAKSEAKVEELIDMIERGELRLPEMQRRYVWRSTRVRDLLDSLYRGYPSGAILLWETNNPVPLQDFAVDQNQNPYQGTRLLLDGQQRLTSLSAIIKGNPVNVRGRKRPIEILFNLEHPDEISLVTEVKEDVVEGDDNDHDLGEEGIDSNEDELQTLFNKMTFVVSTKKLEQSPHWVKVTDVFKEDSNTKFLKRAGIENFDDPRLEKYNDRLNKLKGIKKYSYRMDILERNLSYEEVTEIFVRVNSLGAKLKSSDLALAQITAKWHGALKIFLAFQDEYKKSGFNIDLGIILKTLTVFATGQSRFLTVGNLDLEKLQESWEKCKPGIEFATNFLQNNAGIKSPALLSSPFIIPALAYYGHVFDYVIDPIEESDLRKWVLVANAKGRYSRGSSETFLDQDLSIVKQNGKAKDLLEKLRIQVGKLDIEANELIGKSQRSSLFKTMFLAFQNAGAKDWYSNLEISTSNKGASHRLQFHHIFPKGQLKNKYPQREIDDISNLAFIGGKTNRKISDKNPNLYLNELIQKIGQDPFAKQCIPIDSHLLTIESFKEFLVERRKLIAKRLNEFLGFS